MVCSTSASQTLHFFLDHMKACQSHKQKKELWSTDMFFQKQILLYLSTEPAPWGWSEYESAREWISVAGHRKDKRPFNWHYTTRKHVIKHHSLIAATAKECWCEQEYSSQGNRSFLSCSCVLVSSSFFFYLHYFLTSCFSCSFSPVVVLLSIACLPTIFLTVALLSLLRWVCLPFYLFFPSPCLIRLCLVSHECMCEQRVHRTHLSSSQNIP